MEMWVVSAVLALPLHNSRIGNACCVLLQLVFGRHWRATLDSKLRSGFPRRSIAIELSKRHDERLEGQIQKMR